jgi:hypothetical protein
MKEEKKKKEVKTENQTGQKRKREELTENSKEEQKKERKATNLHATYIARASNEQVINPAREATCRQVVREEASKHRQQLRRIVRPIELVHAVNDAKRLRAKLLLI